jgi:signal transduction histidine kinase
MGNNMSELENRIKELEDELVKVRAADMAKSKFLSYMNHELRTPLHGVVGYLDLITPEIYDDKKELFSYIAGAKNSASSCLDIINNILDLAKMESGKMELELSAFSLSEVTDSAVSIVASIAAQKGLSLNIDIDNSIPKILVGDALRLRQVLLNIIRNAIKFTESGSVTINLTSKECNADFAEVLFSVVDTGIGIPKSKIDRLFIPYSQITGSATKTSSGTGLGLIISRQIVNLMGGEINVESQEGKGSCFSFLLKFPVRKDFIYPAQCL